MILYINQERNWREQSFMASRETLDLELCQEADMVIEATDDGFRIIKNRFGANDVIVRPETNR